jgi:hypothetical protein
VLLIGVELFAWFYVPRDELEAEFYSMSGYGAIFHGGLVWYLLLSAARLLILVGLLSFHPIARTLFLLLTVATFVQLFFWGYQVHSPVIAPFDFLATLIDGAIIVFAYYTSVGHRFRAANVESTIAD